MRDTFVRTLTEIARQDPNVILMTGDLGFGVLTGFADQFPDQFINAGVAEQNMTGMAAGLALEGKTVFTYSIGNFNTFRCLEQIRNDICYPGANVKIVSIGGGFCYGPLGISHHATEDLAVMRAIPNLRVMAPGDTTETRLITQAAYKMNGPCYLRLGRGGEPNLYPTEPAFDPEKALILRDEGDIALVSTGGILEHVIAASDQLRQHGIGARVISCHTLKPFDNAMVADLAKSVRLLVTVEEHTLTGGLGGAVAEILAELPDPKPRLLRLGLRDGFTKEVGNQQYLRELNGLMPHQIVARVQRSLDHGC